MIKVTRKGDTPNQVYQKIMTGIKAKNTELENEITVLGENATKFARTYINTHRKRKGGTGNLAKAIDMTVEKYAGVYLVGVMETKKLNRVAPYWYIINYGGYTPPTTYGYFTGGVMRPQSGVPRTGHWNTGKNYYGKMFRMIPKKAIRPMYYIEATGRYINLNANKIFSKI